MNQRAMQAYHNKLCRQLGIEPTRVRAIHPSRAASAGWFTYRTREITAAYWGSVRHTIEWVLAHETYHWFQHCKGVLTSYDYHGTSKDYWADEPHSRLPWERAANLFADKVTKRGI